MSITYINVDARDKTNYHDIRFHSLRPAMRDYEDQGISEGDLIPAKLGHEYFYAKDYEIRNYDNVLYEVPIQRKKGDLIHIKQHTMGLAEIVFVIDTTGSMVVSPRTPEEIIKIVTKLAAMYPAFRFGIVLFKDCEDVASYVTRLHLNLTTDISLFEQKVKDLYPSFGGGPTEEAHASAIALAIRQMNWETEFRNIIVLSDAVPRAWVRGICCYGLTWPDVIWMAHENEIKVHMVGWGPWGNYEGMYWYEGIYWYEERDLAFSLMADFTGGEFIVIPDFDNDMYLLEELIMRTVVYYVDQGLGY